MKRIIMTISIFLILIPNLNSQLIRNDRLVIGNNLELSDNTKLFLLYRSSDIKDKDIILFCKDYLAFGKIHKCCFLFYQDSSKTKCFLRVNFITGTIYSQYDDYLIPDSCVNLNIDTILKSNTWFSKEEMKPLSFFVHVEFDTVKCAIIHYDKIFRRYFEIGMDPEQYEQYSLKDKQRYQTAEIIQKEADKLFKEFVLDTERKK